MVASVRWWRTVPGRRDSMACSTGDRPRRRAAPRRIAPLPRQPRSIASASASACGCACPPAFGAEAVHVRAVNDGEPKYTKAKLVRAEPGDDGATWWEGELRATNPVTSYRFLVETPAGSQWVNGAGTWRRDVGDRDDFVVSTFPPPPDWLADAVCYEIFPDRFARGIDEQAWIDPEGDWAIESDWGTPIASDWKRAVRQLYRGDLIGVRQHLDHLEQLGVNLIYLTPVFPGPVLPSLRRHDVRHGGPRARWRRRLLGAGRRRPRAWHQGHRRPHHQSLGQPPPLVRGGAGRRRGAGGRLLLLHRASRTTTSGGSTCRHCRSSTCGRRSCARR